MSWLDQYLQVDHTTSSSSSDSSSSPPVLAEEVSTSQSLSDSWTDKSSLLDNPEFELPKVDSISNDQNQTGDTDISNVSSVEQFVFQSPTDGYEIAISHELADQFNGTSDLTQLDEITLKNVLGCLVWRFNSGQFYTFAGSTLVALNPCSKPKKDMKTSPDFKDLESFSSLIKYAECFNKKKGNQEQLGSELEPHVFSIGTRSLNNLKAVKNSQVIIVTGDSGAGKTTCTQQLIKFLTYINNYTKDGCVDLERKSLETKIYFATIILESFGNASTIANPNSSRFGRMVQLNYDGLGDIIGAEIKTYLLEKHRVAKTGTNERNFHIFYYLLQRGAKQRLEVIDFDTKLMENLQNKRLDSDMLNSINLIHALEHLGIKDRFTQVFQIVYAIMHLLSIKFTQSEDSDDEDEVDNENIDPNSNMNYSSNKNEQKKAEEETFRQFQEFVVAQETFGHLEKACAILGLNPGELQEAFIANKICIPRNRRHSIFRKPCESIQSCESRLQAFITNLYDKLFIHVLDILNQLLKNEDTSFNSNSTNGKCKLSILDLYGFENLEFNHLEQLCINYANERLQQVQIAILKGYFEEEKMLRDYQDNPEQSLNDSKQIIRCAENPFPTELDRVDFEINSRLEELHGKVFLVLNEKCLLKSNVPVKDSEVFKDFLLNSNSKNATFIKTEKVLNEDCQFTIRHYASEVKYCMKGMVAKNKDFIPEEFLSLLKFSKNPLVQTLFPVDANSIPTPNAKQDLKDLNSNSNVNPNTPRNKSVGGKTILMRFRSSVNELVNELKDSSNKDLHFIRCIRPNTELVQDKINPELVQKQLYACGIVDIIRIAGNGYPIRISLTKLESAFPSAIRRICGRTGGIDETGRSRIALVFRSRLSSLKFGKDNVFMNELSWKLLTKYEHFVLNDSSRILQRSWRAYLSVLLAKRILKTPTQLRGVRSGSACDGVNTTIYYTPMDMGNSLEDDKSPHSSTSTTPFGRTFSQSQQFMPFSFSSPQFDFDFANLDDTAELLMNMSPISLPESSNSSKSGQSKSSDEESIHSATSATIGLDAMIWDVTLLVSDSESEPETTENRPTRLYFGQNIVSRTPVHTLPIKFYTKKTALGFGFKRPQRLVANGIQDAVEDYGISMTEQTI